MSDIPAKDVLAKINFAEVNYFYKSPDAFVDYSNMQSFSLIKSTVEVFVYYGITDFSAEDIQTFFNRLQLVKKKTGKVFVPSPKKISGVLECYLKAGRESLSQQADGRFHVNAWDGSGYGFEIETAKRKKKLVGSDDP